MKNIKNILSSIQFFLLTAVLLLFTTQFTWGVNPSVTLTSYYANADGKSGSTLRTTLGTIIASNKGSGSAHNVVSYDNIGYLLKYADTQNANGTTLIDIYTPCTFTISGSTITWSGSCNGATNVGCGLNREHTVPQSWFSKASPMVSDAFHIYATDAASNGHRSDYYYGECTSGTSYTGSNCNESGKLGTSNWTSSQTYTANGTTYTTTGTYSGTVYEPDDEYKGDIARGFFYMATRYASACSSWGNMFGSVNGLTQYTVDLMLKWHRQDPVSEKELIRNEVIYGNTTYNKAGGSYYQGNRNPFIDYPCLVEYIWGSLKDQNVSLSSLTSAYSSSFSGEGCAGGGTTTNYTLTWNYNGSSTTTTSSGSTAVLPSTPANCSTTRVFVGWTKSSSVSSRPSDLFTTAAGAGTISSNTTFYAVYADASTSGSGSSGTVTETMSTTSPYVSQTGWTASAGGTYTTSGNYGASSPSLKLSASNQYVQSATMSGAITAVSYWYKPQSATGTLSFYVSTDGSTFTELSAEAVSFSSSSTADTKSITLSSSSNYRAIKIVYTKTTSNVAIDDIAITYGGSTTTYSNYSLSCSSSSSCTSNPTLGAASSGTTTTTSAPATCSNGITSLGSTGCTITSYGFVYGQSSNPTLDNGTKVQVGTSYTTTGTSFNTTITGLTAGTTYYIRPYATNGNGTGYGSQTNVTTKSLPTYTITWSVNGTTSSVTYNEGESLVLPSTPSNCSSTRVFMGWTETSGYTGSTAPTNMFTTASGTVTANKTYYAVYADKTTTGGSSTTVTDALTYSLVGVTGTSYTAWSGKTASSNAVYAGQSAGGNSSIQIRATSPSAIITTTSGGTATNVTVSWNTNTADNRTLNVYGKTSAYSTSADLYDSSNQGTLIGTIVKGTSTSLDIEGNYTYIGVRSNGSAMYLDELDITWSSGGSGTITYSNYSTSCTTTPTTYNITYKDQGGGTFSGTHGSGYPTTHIYGTATTLVSPTKTGYDFGGWFTNSNCTGTAVTTLGATAYTADITLYAKWTAKTYNITYKDQGNATFSGTHGSGYPTTHTYGTATTLVSPTKTGYTFGGWFTNSNCTGTAITTLGATAYTADITLYAKWTALPTYTVTFIDGTSTYDTRSGYTGQSITVTDPTPCDGFTFEGWSTQQYSSTNTGYPTIDYDGTVPSSNTTYYAVYSVQKPTISLTNNYERITSLSDMTDGNYLVVGNSGTTYKAMVATTTGTYYLNTATVYPSSNVITTSTANRIWQINVAGNHVTFYNTNAAKYVQSYLLGSNTYLSVAPSTEGISFTASVSGGSWTFTSDTDTDYLIRYYASNSRFGFYTSVGNTIYLYKQQTETTYTTYYTTDTSITIEANPNNTTYGSTSITEL